MARTSPQIALQLYTVREPLQANVESALAEVANIGYTNVELAGTYGRTADEFKRLLDQHGLRAVAAHVSLADMKKDIRKAIGDARTLGYDYLMVPWVAEEYRSDAGWQKLAGELRDIGEKVRTEGLNLGYHNHDFEFKGGTTSGATPHDLLFSDPNLLCELDVYWVQKAGFDPVQRLEQLSGRTPILHMKDMADTPEQAFAEAGTGTVPLRQLAQVAPDHGVRFFVAEQDAGWIDGAPLKSARMSYEHLKTLVA